MEENSNAIKIKNSVELRRIKYLQKTKLVKYQKEQIKIQK